MSADAKPAPLVLSFLTADAVHRDPVTGKLFVLGVLNEVRSPTYPATHPFMAAYLSVTDGYGRITLRVRLVDTSEAQAELAGGTLEAAFDSPLVVAEFALAMPGVTFPRPGEYRLQVVHDGNVLADRRLMARQIQTTVEAR